jgi:SAM-dependent methyltransferase
MTIGVTEAFRRYSFYHCIDLGDGVMTPGIERFRPVQQPVLDELRRHDLRGKRALDIGCRDGLFSFEMERLGAQVDAIDNDLSPAAAEFLVPYLKSQVRLSQVNLYDLSVLEEERYDFVIFAGVLYHLRMPFLGLKRIADAMKQGAMLLLETALLLSNDAHPFMLCPPPEESPYYPDMTSVTFFNHRGLAGSLPSFGFDQIRCCGVVVPLDKGEFASYPSRETFLEGPHGFLAARSELIVGRATYICRRCYEGRWSTMTDFWYGTHRIHTTDTGRRL